MCSCSHYKRYNTKSQASYNNFFSLIYDRKTGTQIAEISAIGKPTVCANYLFISERISGKVSIYDISYLTDPTSTATGATLIGTLNVNGNPDIISTDGTIVYIPLGYQGLLIIDTTKAFTTLN